jgi:hypothetical protein
LRRLAGGLAGLAVLLLALAPPGFMVARQDGRAALVICTGHRPSRLGDLPQHGPAPADKSAPSSPCVFAGLTAMTAPPVFAVAAIQLPAPFAAPIAAALSDLAPGRGLAAPPPPSRGPPENPSLT